MPRIANGNRWIVRMRSRTADELSARADAVQARIQKPANTDDPLWMQRGIDKLRHAAARREKAALVKRLERAKPQHREPSRNGRPPLWRPSSVCP